MGFFSVFGFLNFYVKVKESMSHPSITFNEIIDILSKM